MSGRLLARDAVAGKTRPLSSITQIAAGGKRESKEERAHGGGSLGSRLRGTMLSGISGRGRLAPGQVANELRKKREAGLLVSSVSAGGPDVSERDGRPTKGLLG
jgi:hypothetical protein